MKKYIIALAAALAFAAHSEPPPTRAMQCQADMRYPLGELHDRYNSGTDPAILEYLILTDKKVGGGARWVLDQALHVLMHADAAGKMPTRDFFVGAALEICNMEPKDARKPQRDRIVDTFGRDGNDET